jgi:hypothetical protein
MENQTILLDIYERLGAIETQIDTLIKSQDSARADIDNLKEFKSRLSAYVWLGGSIVSGVLFFLFEGIKYGLDRWVFIHH